MKRISLFTCFILLCLFSNAQDTILKHNGDKIIAKILEISTTEIKYKKFDFQDGPVYIENKSNIQLIKYSNGTEEKFEAIENNNITKKTEESYQDYYSGTVNTNNKIIRYGNRFQYKGEAISERGLHDVFYNSKDKQIIKLAGNAKDAKNLQYIGFAGIPLGISSMYFFTRNIFTYNNVQNQRDITLGSICLIAAVACPAVSIYFKTKRNYSNREAIRLYNEKF